MIHSLKTDSKYFQQIKAKTKKFEMRKNDRGFQIGDTLILDEWRDDSYTSEQIICRVIGILNDWECKAIQDGFCIMSIKIIGN